MVRVPNPSEQNDKLDTVLDLAEREVRSVGTHQRVVERFISAIARPIVAYILLASCCVWIVANLVMRKPFDAPPFPGLESIVTLYAAVVATCVLITQSREKAESDRRARLELHVSLVGEQKATKIVALLEELRRDLPNVRDRTDTVANELQNEVDARAVHSALGDATK